MPDRVVSYVFRGSFGSLNAGLATAGRNVGELGTKLTALDKNGAKMRAGLTTLGGTAGKVGLIAAAGLGAAVFAAARFDKAMSAVQAATHETADNMELLRAAAIKAGADTVYSASEAAGAIEELAKAGVSTKDILAGGLSGALNLAAAGAINVSDAAAIAATAMTQFKLSGDQVNHVADLLAAGAGKAQGGVDDLGMALKQSGLVASQFGLSVDDTVGSLTAFASAGLLGSDAGTSFKQLLLSLANPSTKAANAMQDLGIQAYDAQGKFVGITNLAGQLQEAFKGQTDATRDAALATIFGSDAIRAANVLYTDGASGIQGWIDKTNDAGYAADTAATRLDNLAGDFEQLKGSLETALIGAGEGSQAPLRKLVQGATDAVNAFNKLSPSAQSATSSLLAITAITGGGLWFTSKVIRSVAETRTALDGLGISAGKTTGRLAKIGATSGTILVAAQAIGVLVNATTDLGNAVNGADIDRDLEAIASGASTDSLGKLASALEGVNEAGAGTVNALLAVPSALTGIKTDFATNKETIDQFDQSLASLVESGHAEQAAAAFQAIRDAAAARGGVSDADVVKRFDAYKTAMDNVATSTEETATATQNFGTKARTAAHATALLNDDIRASRETAKGTADAFVGLGDSLNNAKKSLGQWIADMQKQADALKHFRQNAEQAADKGLRQGLIKALQEAGPEGALRMKQLANATDAEIKKANSAWQSGQREVKKYTDAIGGVPTHITTNVDVKSDEARRSIDQITQMLNSLPDAVHTTYYINTVRSLTKPELHGPTGSAKGSTVIDDGGPYADRFLYALAPREEVVSNDRGQADRYRGVLKGINANLPAQQIKGMLAGGGTAGSGRSLDSRLEIAQMLQSIRGMERDLAATIKKGKNKGDHQVSGLDREVLELQLEAAERDLRRAKHADEREAAQAAREKAKQEREARANLYATRGSLFDSLVPQDPQTVSQGVSSAIADFHRQWLDAGGKWSKELREWARNARKAAAEYDRITAAITAEEKHRDDLTATLDTQKSQYDALTSTMKSFLDSVAANFQSNVFNGATTKTVAGAAGPATAALKEAQAELASLRASNTADSVDAARQAADLIARIKELQTQADAEVADTEVQVSGLDALRAGLASDTANALAFAAALKTLKDKGLDTSGDFGGLYASLAQSGDLATAQQIANLSPEAIDELEKAYKARDDAAIAAGYQATQDVYGQQAALLATAMQQTQAAIDQSTAAIELMNASLPVIADNVRAGTAASADELKPKLSAIHTSTQATADAVKGLARELAELQKTAKP